MDLQLSGKRAVVTGGSRGIGYAVADTLAAAGFAAGLDPREIEATLRSALRARGLL